MPALGSGPVFAVDHLAAGEPAGCADTVAPGWGSGRCLLRLVPGGAEAHRPRCRRHLRCGARRRLFNAHYDDYGFQPIVVFDQDGRFVTALLRPAKRPSGREIRAFLRRLVRAIRANWPQVAILVRADSHYACPEVLDWCEANGIDYVFGLAPTSTWKRHV